MQNLIENLKPGDKFTLEGEIVEAGSDEANLTFGSKVTNPSPNAYFIEIWTVDKTAKIVKDSFKLL